MTIILLLSLVIGFAVLAPHVRQSHGGGALWLLAAAASLLAALAFAFLDEPDPAATGSLWGLFFWPALIAAGAGFGLLALLISRRHGQPEARPTWVRLLFALVIWLLGAAAGGAVAVGTGLLLLSGMAP